MKKIEVKIKKDLEGRKIENILKQQLGLSESLIRKLKRTDGGVLLNGKPAKVIQRVCDGDVLIITIEEGSSDNITPVKIPLDIIYEDEDIIAVNKPRSMPVHPSKRHVGDTLANGVIYYLGKGSRFHVITRLDRDTSGVVLVAKNAVAAAFLTEEMKNSRIEKEYLAVINGELSPESGMIDKPIKKESEKGIKRCVSPDGKNAVTEYRTLKKENGFSLVQLFPRTGRTHQIRVHLSHSGCPIYGDSLYGAPQKDGKSLLHCATVTFIHPESKKKVSVSAPLCKDMKDAVKW